MNLSQVYSPKQEKVRGATIRGIHPARTLDKSLGAPIRLGLSGASLIDQHPNPLRH